MTRILTLMRKEFLELRQTPRLLVIIDIARVLQLSLLGYAATTDVKDVPIAVVDGDRTPLSRQLVQRFAVSPYFHVVDAADRPDRIDADLALGRAWLAVVVPPGFQAAIGGHGPATARTIQVLADGTDSNSSGVALSYVASLVGEFSATVVARPGGRPDAIDGRVRVWFNPELESRNFMVPGVLALLLLVVTANLSSMAIVRERELGTLEQLNVTPLTRWQLILGKLLPYALIGLVDVVLVVSVAVYWFEVPLRGSFWLLMGGGLIYLVCTLGLGLLVSTISSTQQQAMMTSTFFFLVPMVYLSGFIFPIENMPPAIQALTTLIPLRYFLVIVRGVFLKGVGLDVLWKQFAAMAGWGLTAVTLAAYRSHKRD
jgi:ABC-2 type transport system permease protein